MAYLRMCWAASEGTPETLSCGVKLGVFLEEVNGLPVGTAWTVSGHVDESLRSDRGLWVAPPKPARGNPPDPPVSCAASPTTTTGIPSLAAGLAACASEGGGSGKY